MKCKKFRNAFLLRESSFFTEEEDEDFSKYASRLLKTYQ